MSGGFFLRICILVLTLFTAGRLFGAQDSATSESGTADNPPSRVARVSYLKGNVSFLRASLDQRSAVALNFPVTTGDRIYTDTNASAELEVGSYAVRLASSTDLTMANLNNQVMQLSVYQGTLRVSVYEIPSGNTVEVDSPNGSLTVREQGH